METLNNTTSIDEFCHPYVIYCHSQDEISRIQKEVDGILSDYVFYPEIDWGQYGYRPPENYNVLGAWRHPESKVFIFLLDNPFMVSIGPNIQLILYMVGVNSEVRIVENNLNRMKNKFSIEEKKIKNISMIETRLDKMHKSKSMAFIITIVSVFTAIINAFSLYLRKLPPPIINNEVFLAIYESLIIVIHITSLILLIFVIFMLLVFLFKYSSMLIKR